MDYRQKKIYTAFMESVCKEFKCMPALPALKEGFKALCEAEGSDGMMDEHQKYHEGDGLYFASNNFLSRKPREELDVNEIMNHLDTWYREPFRPDEFEKRIEYFKRTPNHEVIVDEPNMIVTLSSSKKPNGYGDYHYNISALKVAPVDVDKEAASEYNKYLGLGKDRDPSLNPKTPKFFKDITRDPTLGL